MSLNTRIILSATLVLVIFITLTAAALERAFVSSAETALRDKLTSQLYALMAAAEVDEASVIMPSNELDALLGLPSSGVVAMIADDRGDIVWQSSSALGAALPRPLMLDSGEKQFTKTTVGGNDYYQLAYGINWSTDGGGRKLSFNIATDLASFNKQIAQFRRTLWSWLLAMAALLLLSQALILRWGLSPLRRVGRELNRIETGEQEQIKQHYPQEIERLTENINLLLQQEREQKTRYRNALGDLAHSLKTPLAVMQSHLQSADKAACDDGVQQQLARMNEIVEYQLQRAAAGSASIGKSVDVNAVLQRMTGALQKVYAGKEIALQIDAEDKLRFQGDEGDLMELLGNPLDNAFKWAKQQIALKLYRRDGKLHIHIADDGPGIAPEQIELLLQRGKRADENTPGHGIGLSIVKSIVDACNGELKIQRSQLGGAEIVLVL